jgi:protein TonB
LSLKRFFSYSIAIHTIILVAAIFFTPVVKEKRTGGEFFTRLVSPDEFLARVPSIPAISGARSVPHARPKATTPTPLIEDNKRIPPEKGLSSSPSFPPSADKEISPSQIPSPAFPSTGIEAKPESKGTGQQLHRVSPSIREKLFDKNIIGDLAKREIEKEEKEKKDKTLTFDTNEYKFLIYNRMLKEKIESIWIYPPDEAARGIYGDLIIKFTIKKNGILGAVEIIRTSGHKNLDDAAIKALRDGEPYWPLPDEWGMQAYTIVGHFVYTIYGYYIR